GRNSARDRGGPGVRKFSNNAKGRMAQKTPNTTESQGTQSQAMALDPESARRDFWLTFRLDRLFAPADSPTVPEEDNFCAEIRVKTICSYEFTEHNFCGQS